jgi:hypothetical protein
VSRRGERRRVADADRFGPDFDAVAIGRNWLDEVE